MGLPVFRLTTNPEWCVASSDKLNNARLVIGLFHEEATARWFAEHWKGGEEMMRIDMREHAEIREQVRSGLIALKVQGRQIWGDKRHTLPEIVGRLMVGVGDLARLARDGFPLFGDYADVNVAHTAKIEFETELKKELGNVLFSTIRWIDDLGLDALECLDLAIKAQEEFVKSGRPR